MSNRVLSHNVFETIMPVCEQDIATCAHCETVQRAALHEQLSYLASAFEWPDDEEQDDTLEVDCEKRHPFTAHHVNVHIDCDERTHSPSLSLIAAPAEATCASATRTMHDSAYSEPHPGTLYEVRQEGNIQSRKPSQHKESPATRGITHHVLRDVMQGLEPHHVEHQAETMPRPLRHGCPKGGNASVTYNAASARMTVPYDFSFAAYSEPHPGTLCEVRQEGNIQPRKPSQHRESPATRGITHHVLRDVMQGLEPHHVEHQAETMPRPLRHGCPKGGNASVNHNAASARMTVPYDFSLAAYCLAMSWPVFDAQTAEEPGDYFDSVPIGDESDALIEERGVQRRRTGGSTHRSPIRIRRQAFGVGEDRVEGIVRSVSLHVKAAADAVSARATTTRAQPATDGLPAYGEVAPWRLLYTFRSWHGAPSIEITQGRASFDRTGRARRLMLAVTAGNHESSAAARREIACALAREDAPPELADATIALDRAVTG